jgi:hypothetical protein
MAYGDSVYGESIYKCETEIPSVSTRHLHLYCLHYGLTAEQGQGWSKREGEAWVNPESQAAILTIINGDYRQEIVYDENDGLPYIIDTIDGPVGSGLVRVWKDKVDPFIPDSGNEIAWDILFGEHTGELEQYFVDHVETFLSFRPIKVNNINSAGYDKNGFPQTLKINFLISKDGKPDSYAKMESIPVNRDIIVTRHERGNALQIELTGNSSEFKLRKIESVLKVSDTPRVDPQLTEEDYQFKLSDLNVWISRGSGLINRVNGQEFTGTYDVVSGPNDISDAGINLRSSVAINNNSFSDCTLLFWRKGNYSISGVELTDYNSIEEWVLSFFRGEIPSNIVLPTGIIADFRIANSLLTDAVINNYFENIEKFNGDVYLP